MCIRDRRIYTRSPINSNVWQTGKPVDDCDHHRLPPLLFQECSLKRSTISLSRLRYHEYGTVCRHTYCLPLRLPLSNVNLKLTFSIIDSAFPTSSYNFSRWTNMQHYHLSL